LRDISDGQVLLNVKGVHGISVVIFHPKENTLQSRVCLNELNLNESMRESLNGVQSSRESMQD
jgi:hypothetical protein